MTGVAHQHATARAAQNESGAKARRTRTYYNDIKHGFSHLRNSFLTLILQFSFAV
jgi:hypothetical protein